MSIPYFIPAGLAPFKAWNDNFDFQITDDPTLYGLTAGQALTHAGLTGGFNSALTTSTTPGTRTPVAVATTQSALIMVRQSAADLVQIIQASGLLTEPGAAMLGITWRKTTKTPIAAPTAIPSLDINRITPLGVELRVRELGAELSALPPFCVGYQVRFALDLPTPPMSPDSLALIGTGTRRFFSKSFEAGDVGKQAYFAVRYVTAKQLTGPWSNIVVTTVVSG